MNVVCPGCGVRFDAKDAKVPRELLEQLELQPDGTAYRGLKPGEERHIDQRLRCKQCNFHQR